MNDKQLKASTTVNSYSRFSIAPWPAPCDEEIAAVDRVLRSGKLNYWTGCEGRMFEREFADYAGAQYAVAVANGTVGLELALAALEIGSGDEVIVPSRTFIATASAVVMRGAIPVFADVDRDSQNITPDTIQEKITPKTRAIIPVHLAGWPCEMHGIQDLAAEHGLYVIEDCAQAHGARYRGQHVGTFGDVGVFSFCQDKILTTGGEGGMLVTNRSDLWKKAWSFKDHGKCYDTVHQHNHGHGFRWLHKTIGTNWRMTEMQAAIGRAVLRKLDEWVACRRRNAAILQQCFSQLSLLRTPTPRSEFAHSYYKCYTFVRPDQLHPGWDRERIISAINARGVPCFSGSCGEIYQEEAFPSAWQPQRRYPVAKELSETSLMFLVHPTLDAEHTKSFSDVVYQVCSLANQDRQLPSKIKAA